MHAAKNEWFGKTAMEAENTKKDGRTWPVKVHSLTTGSPCRMETSSPRAVVVEDESFSKAKKRSTVTLSVV